MGLTMSQKIFKEHLGWGDSVDFGKEIGSLLTSVSLRIAPALWPVWNLNHQNPFLILL